MIELTSLGHHSWIVRDGSLYLGAVKKQGRIWQAWRYQKYIGDGRLRSDAIALLK